MSLRESARTRARWTLAFGVQRGLITWSARRGDPVAALQVDPALHRDPFATYEQLRARGPVVRGPIWATVDHQACNAILRSEDFGTGGGHGELPSALRRLLERITDPQTLGPVDPPSMLAVDPPLHTRYRQHVARAFTARRVGRMTDRVEAVAVQLLDDIAGSGAGTVDLVERYAALLPVAVISDLLGVPEEERERVLELGNLAATTLEPALSYPRYRQAERALRELHQMFARHVQRLRAAPGDDLLSQIIRSEADDPLTDVELHQVGLLVLGAGFETTVNLIANAVALLDRHPDQLRVLQAEPDLWANAVDEVLRHESPVQMTMRVALRDVDVAGTRVPAGRAILAVLGGANRDPAVFAEPERFDVRRSNAHEHVAFSAGVHYCVGASLARLEATVALRLLYERFPELRLAGEPERRETRILRGYERLPVATGAPTPTRTA